MRIGDRGNQRGCDQRANAGNVIKASADFAHPVPGENAAVRIDDLTFHHLKLSAQGQETIACRRGDTVIVAILDDVEQPLQPVAADACDNTELGKMGTQGIN